MRIVMRPLLSTSKIFLFITLLTMLCSVTAFSRGAPESACDGSMMPRHGFHPQDVPAAVEIVLDQYTMRSDHYLRVTLRGQIPFKGFLLKAEDILDQSKVSFGKFSAFGMWYIPYLNDSDTGSESEYLHCNGKFQNAVTHTGKSNAMYVVSFQWKPPMNYQGMVTFRATVVKDYKTFWTDITSPPVHIVSGDQHILVDSINQSLANTGQDFVDSINTEIVDSIDQSSEEITTLSLSTTSHNPISVEIKSTKISKSPRIDIEGERDYNYFRTHPPSHKVLSSNSKNKTKVSSESGKSPKSSLESIKSTISTEITKSITTKQQSVSKNRQSETNPLSEFSPSIYPQNNSELERRARTNVDVSEMPYQRLQAQYGGFDDYINRENGAYFNSSHWMLETAVIAILLYLKYQQL